MGALARALGDPTGPELADWLGDYIGALSANGVANLSLAYSVASNALTIAAKQQGGSNASSDQPIVVNMRSATAASGDFNVRSITAALSLVVSSGSTLGHGNSDSRWTYVYLIDNSGTLELAVSSKYFGAQGIVSTTAEGGAGAADSATVMYSTTARSNVPFVCVGRFVAPQTTGGTWAAVPTSAQAAPVVTADVPGTTAGDSAATGSVGESVRATASSVSVTTTNTFQDATSISLTAGDWDVSVSGAFARNGATWQEVDLAVTPNSGNTTAGAVDGDNYVYSGWTSSAATPSSMSLAIPTFRVSVTSTTTYYLKIFSLFSAGNPLFNGRVSARRAR